jgi:hypothetical protein
LNALQLKVVPNRAFDESRATGVKASESALAESHTRIASFGILPATRRLNAVRRAASRSDSSVARRDGISLPAGLNLAFEHSEVFDFERNEDSCFCTRRR